MKEKVERIKNTGKTDKTAKNKVESDAVSKEDQRHKARDERDKNLRQKYPSRVILKKLLKDIKPISGALMIAAVLCLISISVTLTAPRVLAESFGVLNNLYTGKDAVMPRNFFFRLFVSYEGVLGREQIITCVSAWCLTLLACYVFKCLSDIMRTVVMNNTVSRYYTANLRIRMSAKIKRLPVRYVDTTPYGELIARMMHDVSRMGTTIHSVIEMLIMGVIQTVAIVVIMFIIQPVLAAVVLCTVPVSLILATVIAKRSEKYHSKLHRAWGDMYAAVEEHYGGFNTVKAYNFEARQQRKIGGIVERIRLSGREAAFYSEIVQPIISFTFNLGFVFICVAGGYMAINYPGRMSVVDVIALITYAKLLSSPLETIANSFSQFQRVLVSARRVYDVLDTPEAEPDKTGRLPETRGSVEFEHVAFSYTDEPLITDLSFKAKSGQKIAIVGPTGGGKTTVVNLLMRFYDIQRGAIIIDGVNAVDIPRDELRNLFSMVLQDTWIFKGTVEENVAYGKENVTHEDVVKACETAYCDHFIRLLPQGYDTVISNDFTSISAGQKQLLTIARAFIANRKMLILDEATSNVDTRTEIYIQKAMDELMRDRTSFVIAHRLSTIVNADLILVINKGDIVESGTHKQLLDKKGFYHNLYHSQYALIRNE